jgi:Uri superfamily endonuclease
LRPRAGKRLFWNVDYLLDQPAASLTHVVAIRSSVRLEAALARLLQRDPATFVLAPGLGAADDPGSTHLLEVEGGDTWWAALLPRLEGLVSARQLPD